MISKEKAIGIDNLSFKPLIKRHSLHLIMDDMDFWQYQSEFPHESMSKSKWHNEVINKFAARMTTYFN